MNCLEAQRLIRPFLYRKLSGRKLEQFLDHVEHCSDCMDELEIHYTIMTVLDDEPDHNLGYVQYKNISSADAIGNRIREARSALQFGKLITLLRRTIIVLADIALVLVMAGETGILDKKWVKNQMESRLERVLPKSRQKADENERIIQENITESETTADTEMSGSAESETI